MNRRRALIASSHPLFSEGIRRLLSKRDQADVEVLGVVKNAQEAFQAVESLQPDLLVVDHDDVSLNQEDVLRKFIGVGGKLRVVFVSLLEDGDQAVVYDRRNFPASQVNEWLGEWPVENEPIYRSPDENSPKTGRGSMRHWIGVSLLVILLAAAGIFGLRNEWLLTRAASVQAQPIDQLFSYLWILISVLGALIIGFVLYSIIFFRRKPGDESDAAHIEGNNALEVTWTVLPLVAVVGFAVLGSQGLAEVLRVDPQALEVRVIGQQWSWRFEYPEQGIISDELYLPLNQQVLLRMESSDVLHSFWVPEFRVKQDLLPGTETQLRITPNRLGDFEVVCAEICGQLHTTMVAQVHVVGESEFERWIIEQSDLPEDPVARGAIWVEQFGCLACHTLDGTPLVGPTWQGLAGRQETMTDGTTVTADEAYLRQSILDPQALIVQGFPAGVMPQNYGEVLTDLQLDDIIAYLQTLR